MTSPNKYSQFIRVARDNGPPMFFDPRGATSAAEARRRAREFRDKLRMHLDERGLMHRPAG